MNVIHTIKRREVRASIEAGQLLQLRGDYTPEQIKFVKRLVKYTYQNGYTQGYLDAQSKETHE
jgi:hypothetical protein